MSEETMPWREFREKLAKPRRPCPTDSLDLPAWLNPKRIEYQNVTYDNRKVVYFIGWKGGPVKIGSAKNAKIRLAELQIGCPFRLHIWALTASPVHSEPKLHRRFNDRRLMGEWFEWHPMLEAMMASLNGARIEVIKAIRARELAEDFAERGVKITARIT